MGITKRPADSTDEIIPVETIELDDISSTSDSDEDNYDLYIPPFHIINSVDYYRSLLPELIVNDHNEVHSVVNNDNTVTFKKKNVSHIGRKKANRLQNENFLLSLINDQYSEDEIFLNDNKNGFTKSIKKLCTRPDLQELFIEGNDDLVLQKGKKYYSNTENNKKKKRSVCPELAFKNLTTSQKSLFKRKSLPIAAIDYLETEIVGFFSRLPNGVYMSSPLQNYNRILLHSIVRYYSLDATSLNSRGHRSQKIVQVRNDRFNDFQPPQMSLLKFALSLTAEKHNETFSSDT